MVWRKRLSRVFLLLLAVLLVGGFLLYRAWTDPTTVRQAVLQQLGSQFPGAEIRLEAAELRLFGGVRLRGLTLARLDEPGAAPFASFPDVIVYPDRQALGQGRLVVRKIELMRPRITVVRRKDGTYNLAGLTGPGQTEEPTPLISIQHGTLIFIDEREGAGALELREVAGTVQPGECPWLQVRLEGEGDLTGPVALEGMVDTKTGECQSTYRFSAVPVGAPLLQHLAGYVPGIHGLGEVEALAIVQGDVAYHPRASHPISYTVHVELHQGRWSHPELPLPITDIAMLVHFEGGRFVLERATGNLAGAPLRVSGEMGQLASNADFSFSAHLDQFLIDSQLYGKLPPRMQKFCNDFRPQGALSISAGVRRQQGRTEVGATFRPLGMSMRYAEFPYPVEHLTGTLLYSDSGPTPMLKLELAARAADQPVRMTGEVFGEGLHLGTDLRPGFDLELSGSNLPLDEKAHAALEPYPRTLSVVEDFAPTGKVNFWARLQRKPGIPEVVKPRVDKHIVLNFHEASMKYRAFPYPLEHITGKLEFLPDESWNFTDFRGWHKGGEFKGAAQSQPRPEGTWLHVEIHGQNVLLDPEMEAALEPDMRQAWKLFRPAGRVDCVAVVDRIAQGKVQLDLHVSARGCSMFPTCFPYTLTQVKGSFRYKGDRVTLTGFEARHVDATITMQSGEILLRHKKGYRADLTQLRAEPLLVDEEFLDALPSMVRQAFATLQPDQPVRLITDLILDDPGDGGATRYYWDGNLALGNSTVQCGIEARNLTGLVALRGSTDGRRLEGHGNLQLERAVIARLPLRNVRSPLLVTEKGIVLRDLRADFLGGQLYGPIQVNFGKDFAYTVDLTASQVDLETFARESLGRSGQARGKASARLALEGKGSDLRTLRGSGRLNIDDGARLYDLPLVLNLLTALSGHLPKGSAFQEAHADFVIKGEKIEVNQVELLGDALSLRGLGTMKVDGSELDLEMYGLLWGRTLPLLPPLIDRIPVEVSKQLMKIHIEGSLGDVRVNKEPVPIIVEPIRELWKGMENRMRRRDAVDPVRRLP